MKFHVRKCKKTSTTRIITAKKVTYDHYVSIVSLQYRNFILYKNMLVVKVL